MKKIRQKFISRHFLKQISSFDRKFYCRHFDTKYDHIAKYIIPKIINNCLRQIMKIRWPEKVSNKTLWERTSQNPVEEDITRRRWGWLGHTLRKPATNITHQALTWNPQGKRNRGRPKNTWRRDLQKDVQATGMGWRQLVATAQNRGRWRTVVDGLSSQRRDGT